MPSDPKFVAATRKAANPHDHMVYHRAISRAELDARRGLVPADTRDFTARFFGDPIPGDRRRELFPGKEHRLDWRGLAR